MTPLVPLVGGLLALVAAALILRSYGPRYRVGRLLAALRPVPLAEALELADSGRPRYIRIDGRIDSEEAFEDIARRPLVFRRTRLEARSGGRWVPFEDSREQVPFEVGDGLQAIGIDGDALGDGLVVIRRESTGTVADLGDRAPAGFEPSTSVRAIVEQVSAVEQAVVLGVPTRGPNGTVRLTAGQGRPLILTTLEVPEAMRVIAGGGRIRPRVAAACVVIGLGLIGVAIAWAAIAVATGTGG